MTPTPARPHAPPPITRPGVPRPLSWSAAVALPLVLASTISLAERAAGQAAPLVRRPVPAPVVAPPFYRRALVAGTRSPDGSPGPAYWQNRAAYDVSATLDPGSGRLEGRVVVTYENRSPDPLPVLVLHLHQNLHAPGVRRNEAQEVTGGVELRSVRVAGAGASRATRPDPPLPAWDVEGTVMALRLARPLLPGGSVEIEIDWAETLPQSGAGRMGWSDREVYFVAYWFPKMAVYDDLRGWDAEPYQGAAEFYDGFADYTAALTLPAGWTVMATGELTNPDEVLTPRTRARLEAAGTADTVVHVATAADRRGGGVTAGAPGGSLTWRFRASRVRDFAFTASDVQLWDATSARVPDRDGDGVEDRVAIHAFWRPDRAPLWAEQWRYGKHAIEHHSRYTGFPYPWPHMTSVEGTDIIGGGMEFPMLTLMGSYTERGAEDLYNVTSHELAHMWIPMIVGTNEKRHAWMDEGSTSFLENQGRPEFWPGTDAHGIERDNYLRVAAAELEQSMMLHGDYYAPGPGYGTASYAKPATLLVTLRGLLGDETFEAAYRAFVAEWAYRHPTPWDFFATFERFAGRDLDWFWTSFYEETWTLDHAVAGVEARAGHPVVVVEDRGWAVMPARVRIETTGEGTIVREVPVEHWLSGETRFEIELAASAGRVTRVELDRALGFPDVDPSNDVWTPGG